MVEASDWSGARVCTVKNYRIDDQAAFTERSAPLPLAPPGTVNYPALSTTASFGNYRSARWFFRTQEALDIQVSLFRTVRAQSGLSVAAGNTLGILETVSGVTGEYNFIWDGMLQGAPSPDGLYALRFGATDDCGNRLDLDRLSLVDSTPPSVDPVRPLPAAQLRESNLQVIGSFDDPNFQRYSIELSQSGPSGPWQLLSQDTRPRATPVLLAQWPTGGATGPIWLRYSASDWLENRREQVDQVALLPRALVLQDARLAPDLFSPNNDGTLDASSIALQLRLPALLTVGVTTTAGVPVRRLATAQPAPVGTTALIWNGLRDDGSRVPDGQYLVEISAVDAALPESIDTQQLTLVVDTTLPTITEVSPTQPFVACTEALGFAANDANFDRFESRLKRGGSVVVSRTGTATGQQVLASLTDLPETAYRLEVEAFDRAGNRHEVSREFVLDCTPPTADILLPAEAALLPRVTGQITPITGKASDANFRQYRISLAPVSAPQNLTTLVSSGQAVDAGVLFNWSVGIGDGPYLLNLQVDDLAGNRSEAQRQIEIDGTPPVAQIIAPANGSEIGRTLELLGVASDQNFNRYRVEMATPQQAAAGNWSTVLEDTSQVLQGRLAGLQLVNAGAFEFRLTAEDKAGLSASAQISLLVDGEPPPAPQNLTALAENNLNVRLNWQGSDVADLAGFLLLRNGIELVSTANRTHLDLQVPEARLTYVVIARDRAGNQSAPSNVVTVVIDRTPPQTVIFSPANAERVRGVVSVHGIAYSEADFAEFTLSAQRPDGSLLANLRTSSAPVNGGVLQLWDTRSIANETPLRLRLRARDTSGNESQVEVPVVVDNQPPAAPTGLRAEGTGPDVLVNWNANVEPDLLGYLLYRDGQLVGFGGSLPADLRPLALAENRYTDAGAPDGALTYRVYAIDQSGNVSEPSAPAQLVRDAGPPSLRIARPQAGEEFADAVEVLAVSADTDIASVVFASRAVGATAWIPFGEVRTQAPWRATFEPTALAYGEYDLRAIATDAGGLVDPAPPVVRVRYVDLTPPAPPTALIARADGVDVSIRWTANGEPDLAGYVVERQLADGQWQAIHTGLVQATTLNDAGLNLGPHTYRVSAADQRGNRSLPSAVDTAHVFDFSVDQAFTPTVAMTLSLAGTATSRGGVPRYQIVGESSTSIGTGAAVESGQVFTLTGLPLPLGRVRIDVRITDPPGNISKVSSVFVRRGERPQPPANLQGSVSGLNVALTWSASPSNGVLGYRLYRNGQAISVDAMLDQGLGAQATSPGAAAAVDGDLATAWTVRAPSDRSTLGHAGVIELEWTDQALVAGLHLTYADGDSSANAYRVSAWAEDAGWITIAERTERRASSELVLLGNAYPTSRLRIELLRAQAPGSSVRLQEVAVLQRSPLPALTSTDAVIEGRHIYTVRAVSLLGFESDPSAPWTAEVGDVEAPPAVQLSGVVVDGVPVLDWTQSIATDLRGYALFRDGGRIATIDAAQPRRYVDVGIANGAYVYTVAAEDIHLNQSPRSNQVTLQVANGGPAIPSIARVEQPAAEPALRVVWVAGAGGTAPAGYRLSVAAQLAGPYELLLALSGNEYVHAGLAPGRTYYYRVLAVDAAGNLSALSPPVAGTVLDRLPPATPRLTYPTVPGRLVQWSEPRFDVCGITSAAAAVTIAVSGEAAGQTAARSADSTSTPAFVAYAAEALLSADGKSVLTGRDLTGQPGWYTLASGDRVGGPAPGAGAWRFLHLLPDGNSAIAVDTGGQIFVSKPSASYVRASFSGTFEDVVAGPNGSPVYVIGRDPTGRGIWVTDGDSATFVALTLATGVEPKAGSLARRATDGQILFADLQGNAYRVDPLSRQVTLIGNGARQAGPIPAPVGSAWLTLDENNRLLRYETDGGTSRVLLASGRTPFAATWSPDARMVAIRYSDSVDIIDADSGALIGTRTPHSGSEHTLTWSASWKLLSAGPAAEAKLFEFAGAFCARDLVTRPGLHSVQAVARNSAGLPSAASQPIQIEHSTNSTSSVDLQLREDEVRLFPQGARLGDQAVVYATLRQLGLGAVDAATGRLIAARLQGPAGSADIPVQTATNALSGVSSTTATINLGRLTVAGDYTLELIADPDNRFAESNEANNRAQRTWRIDGTGSPQLAVTAVRYSWAPGEIIRGAVEVTNGGAEFNGSVQLRAVAADGSDQGELATFALPALGAGQLRRFDWQWAPGQFANGVHRVIATLRSNSAAALLSRSAEISINVHAELSLLLQPARTEQPTGTPLPVQIGIDYLAGNQIFSAGRLSLVARLQNGNELTLWQGSTGVLLPGYSVRQTASWPAASQVAGEHTLFLRFVDGTVERSTMRQIHLTASVPVVALRGELTAAPSSRVVLGGPAVSVVARVRNEGTNALSGLQVRLQLRAEGQSLTLLEDTWSLDVAAGAANDRSVSLASLPEQLQSYVALLQGRLPSDPPDSWRLLANLGISAVDGLPPVIGIVAPESARPHRPPVPLAARITDRHSRVERAWYRVDSGEWRTLSADGINGYDALLHGLADGVHRLDLRAQDLWGNEAVQSDHVFTVDATPPTILIAGVVDGELRNQQVVPIIVIEDLHLASSSAVLDGAPYTSGTPITSDGEHQLSVIAEDLAGNRAERRLSFSIDTAPPPISFVSPSDGSVTENASALVTLMTEQGAQVQFALAGFSADRLANAQGIVSIANVPLALGINMLQASATDLAQNQSNVVRIAVTRQVSGGELTGQIRVSGPTLAHGQNLPVQLEVTNGTNAPLDPLPTRLRALDANGVELRVESRSLALAVGQRVQWDLELAASAWDYGTVTLRLDANDGQGFRSLDVVDVEVIDTQPPQVNPVAPAAGSVVPRPTALRATVTDNRAVVAAEYQLDSDPWLLLVAQGGGQYGAQVELVDGPHTARFRATDAAANVGVTPAANFVVDGTAPQIIITGVADGGLYAQAVVAAVQVIDAHPSLLTVTLNGAPYLPDTAITTSAAYTLVVIAEDVVGNRSQRSLRFIVDLDPPGLTFVEPLADAIIVTDSVTVVGATEPLAIVDIARGEFSAKVAANAAGIFSVPNVPLQAGENIIRGRATDAVGNVGPERTRRVFHSPGNPLGLAGTLSVRPASVALGANFRALLTITESAGIARQPLNLRVLVRAVGVQVPALTVTRSLSLAAGQTISAEEPMSSVALALGDYVVSLEVSVDNQWRELAAAAMTVQDLTPPLVSIIEPVAGALRGSETLTRVRASDLGGVAQVQVRVIGDDWLALSTAGTDAWQGTLPLRWEGELLIQARASDVAGNVSAPVSVAIRSDQSPPVIRVEGVLHGQRAEAAVTPVITIEDASAYTSTITLDGQAYVSGTPIATEGGHVLRIVAEDVLGHRSTRQLVFSISNAPFFIPALQFNFGVLGFLIVLLIALAHLRNRRGTQ